jgi:hypothetical protein
MYPLFFMGQCCNWRDKTVLKTVTLETLWVQIPSDPKTRMWRNWRDAVVLEATTLETLEVQPLSFAL